MQLNRANIKHIFFDFDGTLVDNLWISAPILTAAFEEILHPLGLALPPRYFQDHSGLTMRQIMADFKDKMAVIFPDDFMEGVNQKNLAAMASAARQSQGLKDFLDDIHRRRLDRSIVTGSEERRIKVCLAATKLEADFPPHDWVSTQHLPGGGPPKPAPDVYLLALQKYGRKADEVLAFEDSTQGVEAAVGAGIAVVGFIGGAHIALSDRAHEKERLLGAGAFGVIDDFGAATSFLP
jgi:beta-phosphoglucomutase-like phosphatase (HAD superfamily)